MIALIAVPRLVSEGRMVRAHDRPGVAGAVAGTAGLIAIVDGLRLIEGVAGDVDVLVPGHGSIGGADQVHARIDQDRAYVHALRDAHVPSDPRVGPSAT